MTSEAQLVLEALKKPFVQEVLAIHSRLRKDEAKAAVEEIAEWVDRAQKPKTVAFVINGYEQLNKAVHDLQQCRARKAQSVLLMMAASDAQDQAMQALLGGGAPLSDLPTPDIVITRSLWTVGLPVTIERLITTLDSIEEGL